MMGASGQGPQEGGLLVVIPCYLCRGHIGQLHPLTHTLPDSCSSLDSLFALGRKMGREKQTAGSVCPGAHHTPSISALPLSPLAERTQSFLPLPLSPSLHPLGCIGPVSVQRRYNPLTPLNDPEVECSSWMPMGPAGLTPAGAG